jgi:hypothetical protein
MVLSFVIQAGGRVIYLARAWQILFCLGLFDPPVNPPLRSASASRRLRRLE